MKKHSNSVKRCEPSLKRRNSRVAERRDSSEVMAELVSQLRQQLEVKSIPVIEAAREERDAVSPNLDRPNRECPQFCVNAVPLVSASVVGAGSFCLLPLCPG